MTVLSAYFQNCLTEFVSWLFSDNVVEMSIRVSQPGTQILNNDNSYEILDPKPLYATKIHESKLGSLKLF